MSQKPSLPQPAKSVSQALMPNNASLAARYGGLETQARPRPAPERCGRRVERQDLHLLPSDRAPAPLYTNTALYREKFPKTKSRVFIFSRRNFFRNEL